MIAMRAAAGSITPAGASMIGWWQNADLRTAVRQSAAVSVSCAAWQNRSPRTGA